MKSRLNKLLRCIKIMAVFVPLCWVLLLPLATAKIAEKPSKTIVSRPKGNVVAQVANEDISISYLKGYLSLRPQPSETAAIEQAITKRLDELIVSEVLYQEALRQKLHLEPNIRWRIQQMLAQRLRQEKVNKPVRQHQITDGELQAYYDEHIREFQRPKQVRVADIFVAADAAAASEEKREKKKEAEKVLTMALAVRGNLSGFRELVQDHSDTPLKHLKGNTGLFDIQGWPIGLAPNLVQAAFKLEKIGQVCDHIVETPDGYHIIMLTGKRKAVHRPFEKVKGQLRQRMYREEIERAQKEYIESLKRKCQIRINHDVLDELVSQQQAKARAIDVESKGDFPAYPKDVNLPPRKPRGPR